MTKQATSFRLSTSTLLLLKQLAESENRSLTNMLETLIKNGDKQNRLAEAVKTLLESDDPMYAHAKALIKFYLKQEPYVQATPTMDDFAEG